MQFQAGRKIKDALTQKKEKLLSKKVALIVLKRNYTLGTLCALVLIECGAAMTLCRCENLWHNFG